MLQHDRVIDQPWREQESARAPGRPRCPPPPPTGTGPGTHTPHTTPHPEPWPFTSTRTPAAYQVASPPHTNTYTAPAKGPLHGHSLPDTLALVTWPNVSTVTSRTQSLAKGGPMLGSHQMS